MLVITGAIYPPPQGSLSQTYIDDQNSFLSPGPSSTNSLIPAPLGMTQSQFDNSIQNAGNVYSQPPYFLLGPNSNTAANNIIENGRGTVSKITGAIGQKYGNFDGEFQYPGLFGS